MNYQAFNFVFSSSNVLKLTFGLSAMSMVLALYAQHIDGHEPCALCMLSRLIMLSLVLFSVIGLSAKNWGRLQIICQSVALTISYAGVYWSIFQLDPLSRMGCGMSKTALFLDQTGLSSALPWLLEIRAMCAGELATWFGLSFPSWGLLIYLTCSGALTLSLATKIRGKYKGVGR